MNIQYFHKRPTKKFAADLYDRIKIIEVVEAKGGTTFALQAPTVEQFDSVKITEKDHWGFHDSIELEIGVARCSTKDNYNKRLGRLKSRHRMKPQGFWARRNTEDEIILVAFDSSLKIPELVLRKSPKGGRIYFVGVA